MGGACSDKVDIFSYGEGLPSLCHSNPPAIVCKQDDAEMPNSYMGVAELFDCTGVLLWEIVTGQQPRRGQLRECR